MKPSEYRVHKFANDRTCRCWMCGCELTFGTSTVDHLTPKSQKGKNTKSNYRLACLKCNSARGNRRLTKAEWCKAEGRELPKPKDYTQLIAAIKRMNGT